jgi:GT2 family glycosyltransferase
LSALQEGFAGKPAYMLGGPKHNGLPDNLYSSAHQIASDYAEQWFRGSTGAGYFTTNNLAVPREAFLNIGGFNESFRFAHEDREFGARWADHGMLSAWTPGAIVAHRHEFTLQSFVRQQFRYGVGAVTFHAARRSSQARRRFRFEGLRFHLGLVAAPFKHRKWARSLKLAAMLVTAQGAYLAGVLVHWFAARGGPQRRE